MTTRRSYDWCVGWWSEEISGLVNSQTMLPLVSVADLERYNDDCIVERVVGQLFVSADAGNEVPVLLHGRMTVRPSNNGAIWGASVTTFNMADEQFMWHRVWLLEQGIGNYSPAYNQTQIDVKVNRKVADIDELVLVLEPDQGFWGGVPSAMNFQYAAWIRVLVKF